MRAVGPLESRLCILHSQSDHAQTVCIPAHLMLCGQGGTNNLTSVGREEQTNVICFHPYVPLSLPLLRHTGAFYVAGFVI